MAVEIHYVNVGLFWVDSLGEVIHKNDPTVKLDKFITRGNPSIAKAVTQEHRVIPNISGDASTVNSAGFPRISAYLAAEAAADFAFAYMDQTQLITQMIT